jgi:hypothetical protein
MGGGTTITSYGDGCYAFWKDIPICLCAFFLPCCLGPQTTAAVSKENCTICHFFHWEPTYYHRKRIGKKGGCLNDVLDCCLSTIPIISCCAMAQNARGANAKLMDIKPFWG